PCFLTDGGIGKDFFSIRFQYGPASVLLHRAGSLDLRGSALRGWLVPGETVWGETVHPGVENRNRGIPMYELTDVKDPVIAAWNERFLIIAAGDVLSNARSAGPLFDPLCGAIECWIRTARVP
ncbi:MAG: hypothetical protein JXA20_00075, partial [Spirochaetes bacterium]|nr:hypothetical protein [Spirochaetota bacterium]